MELMARLMGKEMFLFAHTVRCCGVAEEVFRFATDALGSSTISGARIR